jgi:hypothetical protein
VNRPDAEVAADSRDALAEPTHGLHRLFLPPAGCTTQHTNPSQPGRPPGAQQERNTEDGDLTPQTKV